MDKSDVSHGSAPRATLDECEQHEKVDRVFREADKGNVAISHHPPCEHLTGSKYWHAAAHCPKHILSGLIPEQKCGVTYVGPFVIILELGPLTPLDVEQGMEAAVDQQYQSSIAR
ncbi:hypothetical protein [Bradyrhizobium niftali]|uniref:hypothetical protein n=1 Tax=Bradyrhizobium niftali TaxID=2560055 RepID=UPI00142FC4EE|nr:hypothetical protein [Bradyrhizobium niftali]